MEESLREALIITSEECAEVIQCISKAMRFGLDDVAPNFPGAVPNRDWIEQELGDVQAMITVLKRAGLVTDSGLRVAENRKLAKLVDWSHLPLPWLRP